MSSRINLEDIKCFGDVWNIRKLWTIRGDSRFFKGQHDFDAVIQIIFILLQTFFTLSWCSCCCQPPIVVLFSLWKHVKFIKNLKWTQAFIWTELQSTNVLNTIIPYPGTSTLKPGRQSLKNCLSFGSRVRYRCHVSHSSVCSQNYIFKKAFSSFYNAVIH